MLKRRVMPHDGRALLLQADAQYSIPLHSWSVQCVVTSPPYWGLRHYRNPAQIGLELTPEAYIKKMVIIFREVGRVLKTEGTLWLNLGDSYLKKEMCGIPHRVAFALQKDGWYLRSDIVWSKPNPMPEAVTDRPTKSHEYIFLLTKSKHYYYDQESVKEPYAPNSYARYQSKFGGRVNEKRFSTGDRTPMVGFRPYHGQATKDYASAMAQNPSDSKRRIMASMERGSGRNNHSVWTIVPQPYRGAHFATFPEKLIAPCILAGARVGDTVFDPFCGTATVGVVAARYQRAFIGMDVNWKYLEQAQARLARGHPTRRYRADSQGMD